MNAPGTGPLLRETQRRLLDWITAPEGIQRALDEAGDPEGRSVAAVVRADAELSSRERLDVYANAYFFRILACLSEDFGALHGVMGTDLFNDLVTAYLVAHPPQRPSLRDAGARLPAFLADAPAAAPFRKRCDFGADLARLEWAAVEAFDAADAPIVGRDDLAAIPPERWDSLRFEFQPALQCLELDSAVQPTRRAYDRGEPAPEVPASRNRLPVRVWRTDERVFHRTVERLDSEALELARGGASFGAVCLHIASECGSDAAPGRAAALIGGWQSDGLIARLLTNASAP